MARCTTVSTHALADGLILTPERYSAQRSRTRDGVPLGDFVTLGAARLVPKRADPDSRWRVLDTGHCRDGLIRCRRPPVAPGTLGSAKKILRPGDVVISRLRPYLRQVGLVDTALIPPGGGLAGSAELCVLRSTDARSIAFLVPCLLSAPVQRILAAAQEGGHHPRFPPSLLLKLHLPRAVLARRDALSAEVEQALDAVRGGLSTLSLLSERLGEE